MHAFSFTQSNLSTLGDKLKEVKIPIPTNKNEKEEIDYKIREIIKNKRNRKKYAQKFKILNKKKSNRWGLLINRV
ncbi:hypothetical protein MBCUT_04940 [Methanobrevibacter cuticularis]|uniref:Uncharacterized protein n=1 Tax=Methanobrevibacter cuticularis TaxID=47311 RepID=A0A166EP95_9EURY|nr:hypothetical protein MBCUT_04940 [Methanobrevibacter cuticularis]